MASRRGTLSRKHTIVFEWKMDARGMAAGRGGTGTMSVDGKQVAQRSLPKMLPFIWAWYETFDIGLDTGTSVDDADYQAPFPFTGELQKITFDLGETSYDAAGHSRHDGGAREEA
jgi:arylsulfatase